MGFADRIKELRRVPASELRPNPRNWRKHPPAQVDAMRGLLAEIGFAGAELARELPDGTLELIDGHLRASISGDQPVPVLVLDVTEAEAAKLLATFDPVSAMAEADTAKLDQLLRDVQTGSEDVAGLLALLAEEHGIVPEGDEETELKEIKVMPPPKMTWVLLGLPTVRFGEINATIEKLASVPDIICETTSNDG